MGVLSVAIVVIPFVAGCILDGVLETARDTAPTGVNVYAIQVDVPHDTTDDIWREVNGQKFPIGNDGTGYHEMFCELWRQGQTFAVVEQDILVGAKTLRTLLSCQRPWCGAHYQIGGALNTSVMLGCTKFSASMMKRHPEVPAKLAEFGCAVYATPTGSHADCGKTSREHDGGLPRTWVKLDTRVSTVMMELGYKPHRHGLVEHLHDYTHAQGCQCTRCLAIPVAPTLVDPTAFNPLDMFR